jgi:hypothetical protein
LSRVTWESETFAYADYWDEKRQRYVGLQAGQGVRVALDDRSLVVKPDVAAAQMQADREAQGAATAAPGGGPAVGAAAATARPGTGVAVEPPAQAATAPRRFHGSVALDPARIGRDAGRIAEEVVQHLSGLAGSSVEVTLEIRADVPDGVPDQIVRTVTENCRTLRFRSHGFEGE